MSDLPLPHVPEAWAPYVPILMGLCRTVLGVLGSAGVTWALAVTASQIEMAVGAAMILIAAGWSAYQKIEAQRALHRAAAAPVGDPAPKLPM
jgi:hypothetical protein